GGRVVVLTVDLNQSDLPLLTAFPIMMANALNECAGSEGELREAASTGAITEVPLPAEYARRDGEWHLPDPDGGARPLSVRDGTATVGPLDRCGIWSIALADPAVGDGAEPAIVAEIACNLADA